MKSLLFALVLITPFISNAADKGANSYFIGAKKSSSKTDTTAGNGASFFLPTNENTPTDNDKMYGCFNIQFELAEPSFASLDADPATLSGDDLICDKANKLIKEGKLYDARTLLETSATCRYMKVQQLKEEADKTDDPKKACELIMEASSIMSQLRSEQSKK